MFTRVGLTIDELLDLTAEAVEGSTRAPSHDHCHELSFNMTAPGQPFDSPLTSSVTSKCSYYFKDSPLYSLDKPHILVMKVCFISLLNLYSGLIFGQFCDFRYALIRAVIFFNN